mgnify:CR=1 FL=1|tara:strand:+ start:2256 stop:2618 length:363 start_codon:yes stop_codon:yes gene_type:complete
MGRSENSKRYRKSPKGVLRAKLRRGTIPDIRARLSYEERRLGKEMIKKALLAGTYDVQEMYEAIKDAFPDHTDKMIFDVMKTLPSKRASEPSVEEFVDRRGIVIPVTGTFPEYYEEGYES